MKLESLHTKEIKTRFANINCKQDVIDLINHVNFLLYGEEYKLITEKGFNYYANPKLSKKRYTSFSIKKKSGGERNIHAPVNGLKHILRPLNIILNCVAKPHFKATGFVPGKSIVDNAKQHVGKNYVYNIDLKDFFHSFDRSWVKYGFMIKPFNLGKEKEELAFLLASLCTHPFEIDGEIKTVLPQGAPTSPSITNILCVKLDKRLNGLAKRFGITYSRYADDISFSSQTNVFNKEDFLEELHRIIKDQKLEINPSKTRLQQKGYRQEVTGLIVNNKVNVNSRYIKQLRNWLYLWKKYGYVKAEQKFNQDYNFDKGHTKNGIPVFENALMGKLQYLKMVKGKNDSTYVKLKVRYDRLSNKNTCIEKILKIWENHGVKNAIEEYQKNNNGMDKFGFIKQLLENEKFNSSQKERFLKLVTNELEKSSGNQASILSDIETIKNKLKITSDTKSTQSIKAFVNPKNIPIVDNAPAVVAVVTDNKTVNKFNFSGKVLSYTTGEITRAANAVTLIVDEVIESIIKKNSQYPREDVITHLRATIYVKLVEDSESQAAPTATPTKADVDVDEKYVSSVLLSKDYVYLEKIIRDIDPRKTSLEDRKYFLSRVTNKEFKKSSLLELINQKHGSLVSKIALYNIDLQYYIVKQTEVIKGMYIKVGIPKDSFIIPPKITKTIAEMFKAQEGDENIQKEFTRYHYPLGLYKFLFNYNQNEILKSTCHDIGSQELIVINNYCNTEEYDFNKHLEKIIEAYDLHEKTYFAPFYLKTRFRVYLTGKNFYGQPSKGWSEESIKINWSSSSLKEWSEKNQGTPPNLNDALVENLENTGFENFESVNSNISGLSIQSFTQLVYHFKHSFHLNGDNPLRAIIERTNNLNNWNENIDFIIENDTFPQNIEHFTDVDKLIQAYKSIIELIIEVVNKHKFERPKVKITAKVNLEEFQLSIHHINSTYKSNIVKTIERTGQHYHNLIQNQVNGLCNFILKAEFESEPKSQINIWNGKKRSALPITDENFKGVEHIFQFPKK